MHVVEEAKAQAAALGVSLNAYILFAIGEQVKRARAELPVRHDRPPAASAVRAAVARPTSRREPEWDDPVVTPVKRLQAKVGRNDPCPCGSGRKAKQCHPELT